MRFASPIRVGLCCAVVSLCSSPSHAALVRWEAEGTFGIVVPPVSAPLQGLEIGDRMILTIEFDTNVPPNSARGGVGQIAEYSVFPTMFGIQFPDLGLNLTGEQLVGGTPTFVVGVANDSNIINPQEEDIVALSITRAGASELGGGGVRLSIAGFAPTSFFDALNIPAEFETADFHATQIVLGDAGDSQFLGGGTLSKLRSIIVPGPAVPGVMMLIGAATVMRRRRM